MLLIPVFLQLAFLWGTVYIGLLAIFLTMSALASTGGAYGTLISAVAFIINLVAAPTTISGEIPAALNSPDALTQAIATGIMTWQALIIALMIGIFVFIGAAAMAYTKALALGVFDYATSGRKANFIDMFRAGRKYWWPVMRYYIPFAILVWLALLLVLPLLIYMLGYLVATQGQQSNLPLFFYLLVLVGALFLLLRGATIFADGAIVDGSRRPIKESLRFSGHNMVETLKMAALLFMVAILVWILNEGFSWVETREIIFVSTLFSLLSVVLYAFWRLWVSAFVVCVWRSRNLARRTPRA